MSEDKSTAPSDPKPQPEKPEAKSEGEAKKRIGIVGWMIRGLALLMVLVVIGAGTIWYLATAKFNRDFAHLKVQEIAIPTSAEAIERGNHLANNVMLCSHPDCHGPTFSGGKLIDDPMVGQVFAPNITPAGVTKNYTNLDWLRIIRHGVKPDGKPAFIMPSIDYVRFSDDEIGAVIAYLKSLSPVTTPDQTTVALGPIGHMLVATGEVKFSVDEIDHTANRETVVPGPTREYGKVLAGVCIGCHGEHFSGGPIVGADPSWPPATNITPDRETGIGNWMDSDFFKVMRQGVRPDGSRVNEVMPWKEYSRMKDDELTALWLYLKTVQPRPFGQR